METNADRRNAHVEHIDSQLQHGLDTWPLGTMFFSYVDDVLFCFY